jgi:hypothetical protein
MKNAVRSDSSKRGASATWGFQPRVERLETRAQPGSVLSATSGFASLGSALDLRTEDLAETPAFSHSEGLVPRQSLAADSAQDTAALSRQALAADKGQVAQAAPGVSQAGSPTVSTAGLQDQASPGPSQDDYVAAAVGLLHLEAAGQGGQSLGAWTANAPPPGTLQPVSPDQGQETPPLVHSGWFTRAPIPVTGGLSQATSVATNDGRIYVIGGGTGAGPDVRVNQVNIYDTHSRTWSSAAPIPVSDGMAAYGSAVHLNGKIYVFGGIHGAGGAIGVLNTTWIYDIASDSWTQGANLPRALFGSAVGVVNGEIYVAGGADLNIPYNSAYQYDPGTDFTPIANLPAANFRIHGVGVDSSGQFHVFAGGFTGHTHLVYDTSSNTWSAAAPMPIGVTDPGVVLIQDTIYVVGADAPGVLYGMTQEYNLTAGSWALGPIMPTAVNNTTAAAVVHNHRAFVYVEGGFDGTTAEPLNYVLRVI